MTYTNHILFRSLDEARRHQRGEEVGKPAIIKPPRDPESTTEYKKRPATKNLTAQQMEEIGLAVGHADDIAKRFNVSKATVYKCRINAGVSMGNKHTKLERRREIAHCELSVEETAQLYGVSTKTVSNARVEFGTALPRAKRKK